ncbi:MAG TPA: hypothetical protein DDY75_23865, partial [Sphingobacterium sp.]|nr:hypothetical protein [Sphingobacterium sp.]
KREKLFKNKTTIILPGDEYDFPVQTQQEFFKLGETIKDKHIFISGTEKDLLAHFFSNKRNFPDVLSGNSDGYYLQIDGDWQNFVVHEKVKNKNKADRVSYFIDEFVKNELLKDTLLKNLAPMREGMAKALLSFDRLTRRSVSKNYFEFYDLYKHETGLHFGRRFADIDGVGILFTFYTPQMNMEMINIFNDLAIKSSTLYTNYKSK